MRFAHQLPRVDSNHDSAVQSRMSCHWTTGQTSGAVEINRWGEPGQIIPLQPSSESQRETGSLQPTTRKSGALEAELYVWALLHEPPDETSAVVLDHADDRPLIDAEVVRIEPRDAVDDAALGNAGAGVTIRRIEGVEKAVLPEQRIAVAAAQLLEGRHHDLGSKGHRGADSRRRDGAIVAHLVGRRAARRVGVKLPRAVVDDECRVHWTVGRSEAPDVRAVIAKLARIIDRVDALRDG